MLCTQTAPPTTPTALPTGLLPPPAGQVRQLLSLAERPRAEVKLAATEALGEIFLGRLLPPRTLRAFERQPLPSTPPTAEVSNGAAEPLLLCMQAYFEAELKALYARFVAVVEGGSRDPLVHVRQRMIGQLYVMINGKPEMERAILAAMINKLGDPDKKVASRLAHLLCQLTVHHPAMKGVLLAEVCTCICHVTHDT